MVPPPGTSSRPIDVNRRVLIASSTSLLALSGGRTVSAAPPIRLSGAVGDRPAGGGAAEYAQHGPFPITAPPLPLRIDSAGLDLPPGATPTAWLRRPANTSGSTTPALQLVVFSPGFLISSRAYTGYLDHITSWGFPVASYDLSPDGSGFLPDPAATSLLAAVACAAVQQVGGQGADRGLYFIGHSRGAKLSVLAAEMLAKSGVRTVALGLIDPVDQTYDSTSAPGSVSSLPALGTLCASGVHVAIIGAGRNRDCIPPASGYSAFAKACDGTGDTSEHGGGCWLVVASDAGHLQFVESPTDLQRSVCYASSKLDEGLLRDWTCALLVAHGLTKQGQELADAALQLGNRLGIRVTV